VAISVRRHPRFVGDDQHAGALRPDRVHQDLHDLIGRHRVHRSGRFVREDHPRIGDQRPGDRHSLPLAAGELNLATDRPVRPARPAAATTHAPW
jgi:hypothetical protein